MQERVEIVYDTSQAVGPLNQLTNAENNAARGAENLKNAGTSAQESTDKLGKELQQTAGRLGFMVSTVGQLASQLGHLNGPMGQTVAGLTNVAGAALQGFAAFGPLGAAIGGVTALFPILAREAGQSMEEVRARVREAFTDVDDLGKALDHLVKGSSHLPRNDIQSLEEQFSRLDRQLQVSSAHLNDLQAEYDASTEAVNRLSQTTGDDVGPLRRAREEHDRLAQQLHIERQNVESLATSMQHLNDQIAQSQADAALAYTQSQIRIIERQERASEASARRVHDFRNFYEDEAAQHAVEVAHQEQEQRNAIYERDLANQTAFQNQLNAIQAQRQQNALRLLELEQQRRDAVTETVNAQTAISNQAILDMRNESASLDDIIAAYDRANVARRAAGLQVLDSAKLFDAGFRSIGHSVLENVGGSFTQGFGQAIVAVVEGRQEMGAALLGMTKQLLEQLTAMAIPKAIFETAEGIAAAASYRYDQAALHFASAATFGVLGAGAALGLYGVSQAQGGAASTQQTNNPNVNSTSTFGSGESTSRNITINLNGTFFENKREQAKHIKDVLAYA